MHIEDADAEYASPSNNIFWRYCRYFLTPKPQLVQDRKDSATSCQAEIKNLKETQSSIQRSLDAVENEFRELLQHSPALQQAVSRSS